MAAQPKERLLALLLKLAGEDSAVADRLRAEIATGADEQKKWLRLMRRAIKKAMDRHGFIDYRNCQYAVEGAYRVLERAQQAAGDGEYELAVELTLSVMREMTEMMQFADDSGGDVGLVMDEAHSLLALAAADMPDAAGAVCFPKILAAAADDCYDGWMDWRMNLLDICAVLTIEVRQREQMEGYLNTLLASAASNYETEAIALLRYGLIQQFNGAVQAAAFLYEHRCFSRLRELLIKEAMAKQDWDQVEELTLEGEAKDKDLPGLVHKWKKYRFEAYRLGGQRDKLLTVGRELAITGDFAEYQAFKALYGAREWPAVYPDLVEEIAKRSGFGFHKYTAVLKDEEDWPRLWEYVQKNSRRILDFYRQLLPDYREDVFALFDRVIRHGADCASKRSHYKDVCANLRLLAKIGGRQLAAELVRHLLFQYPRRPAFREELLLAKEQLAE